MGPKPNQPQTDQLFVPRLDELIDMGHPLVRLGALIDWSAIEREFAGHFTSGRGRPALPPRLVAGLLYLQHANDASDEAVVATWLENAYWQHFTGEAYFQTKSPIDPSSLTRWRQRIGDKGVELLLSLTIAAAKDAGLLKKGSIDNVIVDSTVMPKAVAHPTDSRLMEKSRQHLVKLAQEHSLSLRQNYNREGPRLAGQVARYAHAKRFDLLNKTQKALKTRVARVQREVQRKFDQIAPQAQPKAQELLNRVQRILTQQRKDKNKLYALHAPEVECIGKGKVQAPYEFGVKVSVSTTLKEGFVLGCKSLPGNPFDGHTLQGALEQVRRLTKTNKLPHTVIVDKGYRGATVEGVRILRSGQKRGITKTLRAMIRRRSAIEATIGHMKADGRLGRNPLKGAFGDAVHAILCGAGQNIRLLLNKLRLICAFYGVQIEELIALVGPRRAPWGLSTR